MREPSIITEENPDWMERRQTPGSEPWSWCMTTGTSGYSSSAASMRWRRKGSPAYFRAPAEPCMITGLSTSWAACMMAWICSRLLTLKAGRPKSFSAA